jgi:hypothetical protein
LGTGWLIISFTPVILYFTDIVILSAAFSVIALVTIIIFVKGQTKEPDSQTLHTMVSITLKFLLELILALVWFFVAKKTSITSVLLFFILYLTLTLISVGLILKTLKNKSL